MKISEQLYKQARKQYKDMPWWIELIWLFNVVALFYGRSKSPNGRPRG